MSLHIENCIINFTDKPPTQKKILSTRRLTYSSRTFLEASYVEPLLRFVWRWVISKPQGVIFVE